MSESMSAPLFDSSTSSGIRDLFGQIQKLRVELAEIFKPMEGESHAFDNINQRLDGILESTEHSCDGILQALETILDSTGTIREAAQSEQAAAACDVLEQSASTAMEHCAFQDLTSQRVTKIARDLMAVESRVHSITDIWGRDDIQALTNELMQKMGSDTPDEEPKMAGPQNTGRAYSQDDIDALFK